VRVFPARQEKEVLVEKCSVCGQFVKAEEQEGGICDDCLARLEEEAERAEWWDAMKAWGWGGPWP
jgi:hypothetical protein